MEATSDALRLRDRYRRMAEAMELADREYLASLTHERCLEDAEDLMRSVDEFGFRHDPPDYTRVRSLELLIQRARRDARAP